MEQTPQLKQILASNPDLRDRIHYEEWSMSYNKKADMILMGHHFPSGTFYYPLPDTRIMLRIDKSNKVYGFAIENATFFIKENPEMGFLLSSIIYPFKSFLLKLPFYLLTKQTIQSFGRLKAIISVNDYVTSKAYFAH